ncbi:MAG: hypothetical protein JNL90_16035 [Planctomycetes bacterium]|nr:hypothetical protein [Planctomycetota bacterium]
MIRSSRALRLPLRPFLLLLAVALLTALPLLIPSCDGAPRHHGRDYAAALAAARASEGALLLHVRHAQRDAGAALDRITLADPRVATLLRERFHQATLDAVRDAPLVERLAGRGTAVATLLLDPQERLLARIDGFVEPADFLAWLEALVEAQPRWRALDERLDADPADPTARLDRAELLARLGAGARVDAELAELRTALASAPPAEQHAARTRAKALEVARLRERGLVEAAAWLQELPIERYPPPPSAAASDVERPRTPR